jgi:phosphomannomutase
MTDDAAFGALRYAVDCSNGMAALLARDLFPGALLLNATLDGTFPSHSPNPLKADARAQLAAVVREKKLDVGVIFDGDADRCMFVDAEGRFVQPDYLIPLVARAQFAREPVGAAGRFKVIHDVRTSRGAIEAIREMGCEPVMVPVGHAFAKPLLRASGALCGGELAGHYYFKEFAGCDSGILAARRILAEIARAKAQGLSFAGLMAPIVSRYANSGELNFKVDGQDAAIARVLAAAARHLPPEISRSEIDGLRLEYAEGWINVRRSNTEPYLRLIVECDTPARLAAWTDLLSAAIAATDAPVAPAGLL